MTSSLLTGTMGQAYLEEGDGASAVMLLEKVVDQLRQSPVRSGEVRQVALLSEARLLAGDHAGAREMAERAVAMGESDGAPFNIGLARRALGRIALAEGDVPLAHDHLAAALSTFATMGATFEVGRTRVDLGRTCAARGAEPDAREHFLAACRIFDAAHAPKRSARVRDVAGALGVELSAVES